MFEVIVYPNSVLKQTSDNVVKFDQQLKDVVQSLIETMYTHNGVGLAAPQVGCLQRILVVDPVGGNKNDTLTILVNPTIEWCSEETVLDREGCLSLPGIVLNVVRSSAIKVNYFDESGNRILRLFSGNEAVIVQHEIDHLDGLLMIDRTGPLSRAQAIRDYYKKVGEE